jgi:cell division protein FtsI (penicillin-binding protein 3)
MLSTRKRLVCIFIALFSLFSLLIVQFFRLQIIEGSKWAAQARAQHQRVVIEPFRRGLFYSNTALKLGHPEKEQAFVIDVPKFHLYADPGAIPVEHRKSIVEQIVKMLPGANPKKLSAQLERKSRSRKLMPWLGKAETDAVLEWWFPFAKSRGLARNALFFVQDYKRSYPFGKLLGQVLHTVRDEKDSQLRQPIPTGGLELVFDRILRGKEGKRQILRSPRHPMESGKILALPEDGADVYLTINHYLQAVAEEEIAKAVKLAGAKAGWAVLMEPRTGEIWALAQYPYFEPQNYKRYFNEPALQECTQVKALTDPYEPGSTMKPLTLALALLANQELKKQGKPPLFSPSEKIATANGAFPGRSKPIHDTKTHSYLNMDLALQKSSNIYMARLVQRIIETLGSEWYRSALQRVFGFGVKTGIELPSESPGSLPEIGKLNKNGTMQWSKPTPFSIAFGHNILASSLQMLKSYAVIANGGYDLTPTLVRKVSRKGRDGSEEILLDNVEKRAVKESTRLLDAQIVDEVIRAMKAVTKLGGTARRADIVGYTEAGKTATSEKIVNGGYSKTHHISTFVGFAPAKDARFVLLIAIDEPEFKYIPGLGKNQHAGICCAPSFAEIGLRTLEYLGVEPDDSDKTDWLREVKALKELYERWNG